MIQNGVFRLILAPATLFELVTGGCFVSRAHQFNCCFIKMWFQCLNVAQWDIYDANLEQTNKGSDMEWALESH